GDVALRDAGAAEDPFVGGLDHLLEIAVRQHLLGHRETQSRDRHALDAAHSELFRTASRMCWLISYFTNSPLTRTAFLIARAFEEPWQMMQVPLMPRSGAPPCSA